jgi:putative isomerase
MRTFRGARIVIVLSFLSVFVTSGDVTGTGKVRAAAIVGTKERPRLLICRGCASALVPGILDPKTVRAAAELPRRSDPLRDSPDYAAVQQSLSRGWNTWDVHSVTSHVLLPAGLAIRVELDRISKDGSSAVLPEVRIGCLPHSGELALPEEHALDGSYTRLRLSWEGISLNIESAHAGNDVVLLVRPLSSLHPAVLPTLVFSVKYLWNSPGSAYRKQDHIEADSPSGKVYIYLTRRETQTVNSSDREPHFSTDLTQPVALSTGRPRSLAEVEEVVDQQHRANDNLTASTGTTDSIVGAIQAILGWNTIYDPEKRRVISPVSRTWSINAGGYVIFDWDTFFTSSIAAIEDRNLAYANAIETLRGETREGFVPNCVVAGDRKTTDRSQPPVGAMTVLGLYRRFHDHWLLDDTFEPLLRWNRWWATHRDVQGYLAWGSNRESSTVAPFDSSAGTRQGAMFESGLDNSPMYDDTSYDPSTGMLEFADVGLMSMYIEDCRALAAVALILRKPGEAEELQERANRYEIKLQTLWNDQVGMFLNRDLNSGKSSHRLSPTNFYPLLAHVATPEQADRMVKEHLLNKNEFWGRWIIPSIARDDAAFQDQNYWRGRIWGPMNYLVYLGLRNYNYPQVRREFAQKSLDLFRGEWERSRHVHENYNCITGAGHDVTASDCFYSWGALLAYIGYLEQAEPSSWGQLQ